MMTATAATPRTLLRTIAMGTGLFVLSVGAGVLLAAVVRQVRAPAPQPAAAGAPSVGTTASLPTVADMLNAGLPRKVSADVRLDRVVAGERQMAMEYTLLEVPAHAVSTSDLDRAFKAQLTTSYCEDPASRVIREGGISIAHRYRGNDAKDIGAITVGPLDCNL